MYLKVRQISKIAYVERVANRHVINFFNHVGHTRYTNNKLWFQIKTVSMNYIGKNNRCIFA